LLNSQIKVVEEALASKLLGKSISTEKLDEALEKLNEGKIDKIIQRRGDKWCVIHHKPGPKKGTPIKCFNTKKEALAMHAAIQIHRKFTESIDKDGRPPKAGWDNCMRRAGAIPSIRDPAAFCGNAFHNVPKVWAAFSKSITKCECPVDKTITGASRSKLDKALKRLHPRGSNKIKKEK